MRIGVLLVLFVPLIVRTEVLFPFVVPKAIYARSIIEITLALWVALIVVDRRYRPSRSWVLVAFGVWFAVSLIAGFTGVSLTRSMWSTYERMQGIFDLAHWFAFVLVAGSVFRSLGDWKLLLSVNLGVSAIVSLLGLGQHFDVLNSGILDSGNRITSTLGNATYVGAYTVVNSLVGIGLIVQSFGGRLTSVVDTSSESRAARRRRARRSRRRTQAFDAVPWLRTLWALAIIANMWALWLSGTRGAVLGLGAGAVVFAFTYAGWGAVAPVRKVAFGILVATVAALLLFVVARTTDALDPIIESSTMLGRVSNIGLGDSSIKGRVVSAEAGLRAYQDKPIFGWGPENYMIAWGRYVDSDPGIRERFDQAHSKLVEEITTKGAVGLVTYLAIWLVAGVVIVRSVRRRLGFDQLFVWIIGAVLVAYFAQNLFLFDTPATVMQFCVLIAFIISEEMWIRTKNGRDSAEQAAATAGGGWLPERWMRNRGVSYAARGLTSPAGVVIVTLMVSVIALAVLVQVNSKAYSAAGAAVEATTSNEAWPIVAERFKRSIAEFPGLANYPRFNMTNAAAKRLNDMSDEDFQYAVDLVSSEGQLGLDAEPENWRLAGVLAVFFQVAATRDPIHLDAGREYTDLAVTLAPGTSEAKNVLRQQEQLEELLK